MDDRLVDLGFLWFFAALFVGPLLGWVLNRWLGFERSVGVACLIIGLTASIFAVWCGLDRAQQLQGMVEVEGHLLDYVEERSKDKDGNVTVSLSPRVSYVAADGVERILKGLGGSQAEREPGEAVPVRYRSSDPAYAVIADFQNIWGVIFAFGLFGGLPLLFGIFFLFLAVDRRILPTTPGQPPAAEKPLTANEQVREQAAGYLVIGGNLTFVGAFVLLFLPTDDTLYGIARGFAAIGVACAVYILAELLRPRRSWQRIGILFIVGAGFAAFGIGGLLLSGV